MKVYSLSILSVTPNTPAQAAMLGTTQDLSSFSFYQRGSVGEFMTFFTKVILPSQAFCILICPRRRPWPNERQQTSRLRSRRITIKLMSSEPPGGDLMQWAWLVRSCCFSSDLLNSSRNSAVMITDLEYPYRPAFSLLTKLLDENAALLAQLPAHSAAPSFGSASGNAFGGNPSQAAAGGIPPAQKGKLEGTLSTYLTKYQDPKQADTIMKVQKELDETKIVLVSSHGFPNCPQRKLTFVAAQDDRVCSGAWRKAGQSCGAIQCA